MAEKSLKMGLGEAIQRLMHVELLRNRGIAAIPENVRAERDLIVQALNSHQLDLGFDCNEDGVPDSVEIFQKAAETSCCRILPADTSRRAVSPARAKAVSSRRS